MGNKRNIYIEVSNNSKEEVKNIIASIKDTLEKIKTDNKTLFIPVINGELTVEFTGDDIYIRDIKSAKKLWK